MEPVDQLKMKCAELEQALLSENPEYKNILHKMHEEIRQTPEFIYMLKDEEIAVIVSGLSKMTGVQIAEVKKKEKITAKKGKGLSADDV